MEENICSDRELFSSYKQGSTSSFQQFVARYEKEIYSLAFHLCGSPSDAETILVTVFQSILSSDEDITADCMRCTLYDYTLKAATELLELRAFAPFCLETESTPLADSDDSRAVYLSRLQRSIQRLPFEYRKIFVLHDMMQLSLEDTAALFSLSALQLKARLQRARLMIRRHLLNEMGELQADTTPGQDENLNSRPEFFI